MRDGKIYKDLLRKATLVPLKKPHEFFKGDASQIDALLYVAEAGSASTFPCQKVTGALRFW
ncbi:MAG: hypothetical protein H6750_06455 [Nitrospiraceae bacterium]|nr:hypothetical protein [Nitrospiraceae bacterium]